MKERNTEQNGNCVTVEYDADEKKTYYSDTPDGIFNRPTVQRLMNRFR